MRIVKGQITKRFISFLLVVVMTISIMPLNVLAYMAERPSGITFVDDKGEEQYIDNEDWEEQFPYGTFAFANSELTMMENGSTETIEVYRLGGTKGAVTAYIAYTPLVVDNDGEESNFNAIGPNDIEILVEDPSPDAQYQSVGKGKDPIAASEGIKIYKILEQVNEKEDEKEEEKVNEDINIEEEILDIEKEEDEELDNSEELDSNEEVEYEVEESSIEVSSAARETNVDSTDADIIDDTVYLTVDVEADSYQWYANVGDKWKVVTGAIDSSMPISEEDLEYVDIRVQYTQGENTYCTDSYYGEIYVQSEDYYDESNSNLITSDYNPTYTKLDLQKDNYGTTYFEVTFAEGEWVKEIKITPIDNSESNPNRLSTITIYDCYGGELYDSANTLIISLLDDEEAEEAIFEFEVTKIYADIAQGFAEVTVKRAGNKNHLSTIDYATSDNTAIVGEDYVETKGTLAFYGEVTEQVIIIPLLYNNLTADEETEEEPKIITIDDLTPMQKEELKKFNITLSNIKGGSGKDSINKNKGQASVSLYNSGKDLPVTLASLLNDGDAINVSGNIDVVNEGLIPSNEISVLATEIENEKADLNGSILTAAAPTARLSGAVSYGGAQMVKFSRSDIEEGNYSSKYWENGLLIANGGGTLSSGEYTNTVENLNWVGTSSGTNTVKIESVDGGNAHAEVNNMAQKFQKMYLYMRFVAYDFNFIVNYGVYPEVYVADSQGNKTAHVHTSPKANTNKVTTRTQYKDYYFGAAEDLNAIYLSLIEYNGSGGTEKAKCEILDGYLERRVFTNSNIKIAVHNANDNNNLNSGETYISTSFAGDISLVEEMGGVNTNSQIYVGSRIKVTPTFGATDVFEMYGGDGSVYLTGASGTVSSSTASQRDAVTMLWDDFKDSSINDTYTLNVVYNRIQTALISLEPSVPTKDSNGNTLTGEALKAAQQTAVNDFNSSVNGQIEYGYKTYAASSQKFENKTGTGTVTEIEAKINNIQNLQWINFNLPEEDRIVVNGKTYKGNQVIYLDSSDLSRLQLEFLYYDSEYISVERESKININSASIYVDMNGDGKISGYMENNQFVLEGEDTFFGTINLDENHDESIFAPIVDENNNVYYKYMKVLYSVTPRCIVEIPGKEDVVGQVLPAFTTNVTSEEGLLKLTKEQRDYRFIESSKGTLTNGDSEKYLSDKVTIYGAKATLLTMVDFPLGGDKNPYTIDENGNVTWEPYYKGNLLFEYSNPELVTLNNTIVGDGVNLTSNFDYSNDDGYTYNGDGQDKVNGYLGSYAGNTVFSLVIREQFENESMEDLINDGNTFTTEFDSVSIGGKGTFQTPNGLLYMDTGNVPSLDFNSEEESSSNPVGRSASGGSGTPEGFDIDMGVSFPEISFDSIMTFDGVGFSMSGNRIGFTIGTPILGKSGGTSSTSKLTDPLADNFNLAKKFNESTDGYNKAKDNAKTNPGDKGTVTSKEYGVKLSVSAGFYWEYDPVIDSFVFSEAAIGVTGAFEFTLEYRFAFCPLVYVYVKTGISLGVGTGLGRQYYEVEEDTAVKIYNENRPSEAIDSKGASLKKDEKYFFNSTSKALNFYFIGEMYIEIYDKTGSKILRKGTISSTDANKAVNINIDRLIKDTNDVQVKITVNKDSSVSEIKEVTKYDTIVYFKGVTITPTIFVEVGAGFGIPIAKIEIFIKISVTASFTFGAYNVNSGTYDGAKVDSFNFMASLGARIVIVLFTYELTGVGFSVNYDGSDWSTKWTFLNGYPQGRALAFSSAESSGIKPPQSTSSAQQIYKALDYASEGQIMSLSAFNTGEVPFKLSSYNTEGGANKLADGFNLGYDYKLVTIGTRNFLVYLYSRDDSPTSMDASMLVMSELVEGDAGYGLVNPLNSELEVPYAVIDDDGTGDLDFSVYAYDNSIYISWMNYKTVSDTMLDMAEATKNVELKRTSFNLTTSDFSEVVTLSDVADTVSLSDTLDEVVAYVVPAYYTESQYPTVRDEYFDYIDGNYSMPGSAGESMKDLMKNVWEMRAAAEGKSGVIKLALYVEDDVSTDELPLGDNLILEENLVLEDNLTPEDNIVSEDGLTIENNLEENIAASPFSDITLNSSNWIDYTIDASGNGKVIDVSVSKKDTDTYWIAYITEGNAYDNGEYVTIKKLFIIELTKENITDGTSIPPKVISTIVDYDLTTAKDGLYANGIITEQMDDPTMGTVRLLKGKLENGSSQETLLIYDYCDNTYSIGESEIESLLSGGSAVSQALFETSDGQASGKTQVNIGVDGAGNVSVVYAGTVSGTTNNALFVSKYDTDTQKFGTGQMLAMRNLDVYEYSYNDIGRDWDEKELEKAYYGEISDEFGSLDTFSFSNIQVAYGEPKVSDDTGSLLVVTTGTLSQLMDVQGYDTKAIDSNSSPDVGFYALKFGIGEAAIGEQNIKFFTNNFTSGSILSPTITFKNTGDIPFRASEEYPAAVKLFVSESGGTAISIKEWALEESLLVGKVVKLEGITNELPFTLGEGSTFYLEINENSNYSEARTASTSGSSPYTLEQKMDLGVDEVYAVVNRAEEDKVVLDVSFAVKNTGDKDSENTFVQFSYKTGDDEGSPIYSPLNISENTLAVDNQQKIELMMGRSIVSSETVNGILELAGNDGSGIKGGYSRLVKGTITIPKSAFNAMEEGSFNLKIEAFDSEKAEKDNNNIVIANEDEYNNLNNYVAIPVLPKTFFTSANNIAIPLGNVYKMPVSLSSTSRSSRVSASEFVQEDTEELLGTIYYDYSGYINMMGNAEGSGIMRISDSTTNTFKDIAFKTEDGDGINIFIDNGIFTFYNQEGNVYNSENANQKWEFRESVIAWGQNNEMPLRGDIAIAQEGAYITFDTFADEIDFYFTGEVQVISDSYPRYKEGKTISSSSLFDKVTIDFVAGDDLAFKSHEVKLKVLSGTVIFDKLKEHYSEGIPVPDADKGAPTVIWSRNWPEKASILSGETFEISAFIYDPSEIASASFDDVIADTYNANINAIDKISDKLWRIDFVFEANRYHKISATDKANNTAYDSVVLDCFSDPINDDALATSPILTVNVVNEAGEQLQGISGEDVYFKVTGDHVNYVKVYLLSPDEVSELGYTEVEISQADNSFYKLPSNGYYKVYALSDEGTWAQSVIDIDVIDVESPIVSIREDTEYTDENLDENLRHLFYYATKTNSTGGSSSQAVINKAYINDEDLSVDEGITVAGHYHIAYGGEYEFKAFDNAKKSSSFKIEINDFLVHLQEEFIVQVKPTTNQTKNNGSVSVDLSKATGGNYAGINGNVYYGAYETAIIKAEEAFNGNATSQEGKEYFASLKWSTDGLHEKLTQGDYVIYVKDRTDISFERNNTIATEIFTIENKVVAAVIESTATTRQYRTDGKIKIYPESSIAEAKYEVSLAFVGDSKPDEILEPSDKQFEEWFGVNEKDESNKEFIELEELKSGWYQVAVKTDAMDLVADANDVYMALIYVDKTYIYDEEDDENIYTPPSKPGTIPGAVVDETEKATIKETDSVIIITYPNEYYELDKETSYYIAEQNEQKTIIIVSDDLYVTIPKGIIEDGGSLDNLIVETSELAESEHSVVYCKNGDGTVKIIAFSVVGDKVMYIASEKGTYGVMENKKDFIDIKSHWAQSYINFVTARELFAGINENEFGPDYAMTRAMFIVVLGRLSGVNTDESSLSASNVNDVGRSPVFSDVAIGSYYEPYVGWASENGIVSGFGDGRFGPDEPITREQMCLIIAQYIQYQGLDIKKSVESIEFEDSNEISDWALNAVNYCCERGIIFGMGNDRFEAKDTASRAQVSTILTNLIVESVSP